MISGDETLYNGKIFSLSVHSSPLWAIQPGLRPSQPGLRLSQPGMRPSQPGLRPKAWLAGL